MIRTALTYVLIDKCLDKMFSFWDTELNPEGKSGLVVGKSYGHIQISFGQGYYIDAYNVDKVTEIDSTTVSSNGHLSTKKHIRLDGVATVREHFCPLRCLGGENPHILYDLCEKYNKADPPISVEGSVHSREYLNWEVRDHKLVRVSFNSTILPYSSSDIKILS